MQGGGGIYNINTCDIKLLEASSVLHLSLDDDCCSCLLSKAPDPVARAKIWDQITGVYIYIHIHIHTLILLAQQSGQFERET